MNAQLIEIDGEEVIISNAIKREITTISSLINKKTAKKEEKAEWVEKFIALHLQDKKIQQSLEILKGIYEKD
jgi:hypothetical protein